MRPIALLLTLLLAGSAQANPAADYWQALTSLCGQAFAGQLVDAPADDDFAGKSLVMHVRDCSENRIRIPFVVGGDLSRTWVLTRNGDRITLKHDHRHADGSHDDITMYGGTSTTAGRAGEQFFPADEETREIIEPAFANVWTMKVEAGEVFTYGLWRLGTPRVFRVDFDLSQPVKPPPAPWGWED